MTNEEREKIINAIFEMHRITERKIIRDYNQDNTRKLYARISNYELIYEFFQLYDELKRKNMQKAMAISISNALMENMNKIVQEQKIQNKKDLRKTKEYKTLSNIKRSDILLTPTPKDYVESYFDMKKVEDDEEVDSLLAITLYYQTYQAENNYQMAKILNQVKSFFYSIKDYYAYISNYPFTANWSQLNRQARLSCFERGVIDYIKVPTRTRKIPIYKEEIVWIGLDDLD